MKIRTIWTAALTVVLLAGSAFAQPKPKSQKEVDALMAIQNATDNAARIAAVEKLLQNFADTEFKVFALTIAAASAQQMNDFEKMVIYSERTLEADPKNYQAMLMLATGIAQRTREHDLDREDKLARVEKYAREAQSVLKTATKPNPQLTDEQWEEARKDLQGQAHSALGQAAFVRKKYDVAAQEWKTALDLSPDPVTIVRLANVYNLSSKPDEAIAVLDKISTMTEVHPQIKTAADAERNQAVKLKGGAKPAATPGGSPAGTPGATPGATPAKPATTPTTPSTPAPAAAPTK